MGAYGLSSLKRLDTLTEPTDFGGEHAKTPTHPSTDGTDSWSPKPD